MIPLLPSAYLPPVSFFKVMAENTETAIERFDTYHKQTYRNRCRIATAGGVQSLTVPVVKSETQKQLMKDVRISEHGNWRHLHWNALASAYMNSPFFIYYEDDLRPFYEKRQTFLLDFNQELTAKVLELVGLDVNLTLTDDFRPVNGDPAPDDYRCWADPDEHPMTEQQPYFQVFGQKFGFQPDLSIVDLLFNMGSESKSWIMHECTLMTKVSNCR